MKGYHRTLLICSMLMLFMNCSSINSADEVLSSIQDFIGDELDSASNVTVICTSTCPSCVSSLDTMIRGWDEDQILVLIMDKVQLNMLGASMTGKKNIRVLNRYDRVKSGLFDSAGVMELKRESLQNGWTSERYGYLDFLRIYSNLK